ncbi:MAG TPA: ABC transporter ATP-binding protein [Acidobacteriaceae bacterium]|nr:ABC transporter ATP-binding protein [Acidobacteriaceae bacterium]
MAPRLQFDGISKVFGRRAALEPLSLSVEPGEILGFLGPNGAGKTTAIHLALGFLRPTSGTGSLLGKPFGDARARARLGFVPDVPVFFAERAASSVEFAARLNGIRDRRLKERTRELLASVGLPPGTEDSRKDVRKFSRGMQQRLALAQALINDPELLILDEPASALDPAGVLQVRELLQQARQSGKSVFFSSHQLTEVERICDRIALLREGRLMRYGSLSALLTESGRMEAVVRGISPAAAARLFPGLVDAEPDGVRSRPGEPEQPGSLRLIFPRGEQRRVLETAWNEGGEIVRMAPAGGNLEELFLEWTGQGNGSGDRESAFPQGPGSA